ncbi:MAG: hypothetical protein ACREA4_08665, partial [Nitrososphaera sp.]
LTANVTAGSTAQVVATASSYVEIDPTELVNFMLAFNAVESGNVRFAVVRAICEEIFSNEGE